MAKPPLYLIACCSQKATLPALPADELYTSDLFRKCRQYVQARSGEWYILSAKHGLLHPTDIVAPYDQTLSDMPKPTREAWGRRVIKQLEALGAQDRDIVFLAGNLYRDPLAKWAGDRAIAPMQGLGIGQQKQWLLKHAWP